jgi:hypothetical protein
MKRPEESGGKNRMRSRVARWYFFQTKDSRFGEIFEGIAMDDVGKFYGHFVYFTAIWYRYIFYSHVVHFMAIWYIFPVLVCCTKENLATLMRTFKTLLNRFKAIDKKKKSLAEALTPYFRLI